MVFYILGIGLLSLAIGTAYIQRQGWSLFLETDHTDDQKFIRGGQYRRRMQISILIGIIGLGFCLNELLELRENKVVFVYFWLVMIFLVFVLGFMGFLELIVVRFKNKRSLHKLEHTEKMLVEEIKKFHTENDSEQQSEE